MPILLVEGEEITVGRPRDERIDQTVLAVTAEMCAEVPFSQLSLTEIAERAGTTRRAINRRWPTKAELVIDAFVSRVGITAIPDTGSLRGDLRVLTHQNAQFHSSPEWRGLTLATLSAFSEVDPEYTGMPEPRREIIAEVWERAERRGDRPEHLDPALVTQLLAGAIIFRSVILRQATDDEIIGGLVDAILSGGSGDRAD